MTAHYINQFGLNLLPLPNNPLWVKFDNLRLLNLQRKGFKYFVFVVEDEIKKLYPFKTYAEALDKKLENSHLHKRDNYIMCIDYSFMEIAKGLIMSGVMVLFNYEL